MVSLVWWYSVQVVGPAGDKVYFLLDRNPQLQVPDQAVGFLGLLFVVLHPLTWLLLYLLFEGVVRALAPTITGESPGTLPILLVDEVYVGLFRPLVARSRTQIPDKVVLNDYRLKIETVYKHVDWEVGKIMQFRGAYFRLEASMTVKSERPFVFLLERLPAGVPSRTILYYSEHPFLDQ